MINLYSIFPRTLLWLAAKANGYQVIVPEYWTKPTLGAFVLAPDETHIAVFCLEMARRFAPHVLPPTPAPVPVELPNGPAMAHLACAVLTHRRAAWTSPE